MVWQVVNRSPAPLVLDYLAAATRCQAGDRAAAELDSAVPILQVQGPVGEKVNASGSDEEVLFQANAEAKLFVIESRLDGDKVPLGQYIFPTRIQMRPFLRRKTYAVPQMMIENPGLVLVESALGFLE